MIPCSDADSFLLHLWRFTARSRTCRQEKMKHLSYQYILISFVDVKAAENVQPLSKCLLSEIRQP